MYWNSMIAAAQEVLAHAILSILVRLTAEVRAIACRSCFFFFTSDSDCQYTTSNNKVSQAMNQTVLHYIVHIAQPILLLSYLSVCIIMWEMSRCQSYSSLAYQCTWLYNLLCLFWTWLPLCLHAGIGHTSANFQYMYCASTCLHNRSVCWQGVSVLCPCEVLLSSVYLPVYLLLILYM